MFKAVIFDLDGVLANSVQIALKNRKELLAGYGVDLEKIPDPQGEGHRAASLKTLLANVQSHTGVGIDPEEFAKHSTEKMRQALKSQSADPALINFLEDLNQHGIACAIATSGRREVVAMKLEVLGLTNYFPTIVTGDDVQEHKPHPAAYLEALRRLGLTPEDCIIIEDSLTGIHAGIASGCKVIGFVGFNPSKKTLPRTVLTIQKWNEINYKALAGLE